MEREVNESVNGRCKESWRAGCSIHEFYLVPAVKEKGASDSDERETTVEEFWRLLVLQAAFSHLRRDELLAPCAQPGQ